MFHQHKWVIVASAVGTSHFMGTSQPTTLILKRCTTCGSVESGDVVGHWTLAQLQGEQA